MAQARRTRGAVPARLAIVAILAILPIARPPIATAASPGTPFTWGDNALGQLGNGTTGARHTAGAVPGLTDVTEISGGRGTVYALRSDGSVRAWGSNEFGQIGDGTTVNRTSPVAVSGLTGVTSVAAGHYHGLARKSDGTVWGWGYNALGQLGDGTTTNRRTPVRVSGLTDVVDVAGGRDLSLALKSDGTVWAWGLNSSGQLGDGTTTTRLTPVRVGSLTSVVEIAAGRDHGLAVRTDGTVWTWGDNSFGQLGDGTTANRLSPVQVSGLTGVTAVEAGAFASYALRSDGSVRSWGRNNFGQLGDGTNTQRTTPVSVQGLSSVTEIGAGRDSGYAAVSNGSGWAWGENDFGQVGDGSTTNRTTPVRIAGLSGAVEIAGGRDYGVALSVATDTTPPTKPGTPSGQSTTSSSITISWAASTDASPITYRIYRDGATTPVGSASATTFTDGGLVSGSTHTYTVDAIDGFSNVSQMSDSSAPITVLTPDMTPPTKPGKPAGTSGSPSTIDLSWAASSDDQSVSITYGVFRDGTQVASKTSSSTTTVGFTDTGLAPSSTHTYTVSAADQAGNTSQASDPSDPITTQSGPSAIFSDDFSSGTFSKWSGVTRLTIDAGSGGNAPPSARAQVSSQSAFAYVTLAGSFTQVCASMKVNAPAIDPGSVVLIRLRTVANGPVGRVYAGSGGTLWVRSDVAGTQISSGVVLGSGWHTIELCGSIGASGTWDLYRDGVRIVTAWHANNGSTAIGRLEIGDTATKTFTANFDDVLVDQTPG